jgi:hypothetical protein
MEPSPVIVLQLWQRKMGGYLLVLCGWQSKLRSPIEESISHISKR